MQALVRELNRVYRERAGAVGGRLRAGRLPLARGERRRAERARVRALRPAVERALVVRLQPLAGAALAATASGCRRRPLARGAEHRLGALRRLGRRQPRRGRGGGRRRGTTSRSRPRSRCRRSASSGSCRTSAAAVAASASRRRCRSDDGLVRVPVWAPGSVEFASSEPSGAASGPCRCEPEGETACRRRRRSPPARHPATQYALRVSNGRARRCRDPVLALEQPEGVRGPSRVLDTGAFALDGRCRSRSRSTSSWSTSCTSARSRPRARSTRRGAHLPELRRARRDGGRADAGGDVPRRARLGLRRRAHLRAAPRPTAGRTGSRASSTRRTRPGSP